MTSRINEIVEKVAAGSRTARQYVDEAIDQAETAAGYNALISLTADRAR